MDRIIKSEIKEEITGIPSVTLHGIGKSQLDDPHGEEDLDDDLTEEDLEQSTYDDVDTEDSDITLTQAETARSMPLSDAPMRKFPFKLKQNECGNILTVHHTIKEAGHRLRIQIAACCFNELSNKLVVIDKRGNVFIFDFVHKRYWRLGFRLPKAKLIRPSPLHNSDYIVGNKTGGITIIDVDSSIMGARGEVGNATLDELSWSNRLQNPRFSNALMRFGSEAFLVNLHTLAVSHQLDFDESRYTLKFAAFLPNSDQFFIGFSNDSLHVWSSHSLCTLRMAQPIKARNRKLRLLPVEESVPEIVLRGTDDSDLEDDLTFDCQDHDFADGLLLCYCFTPDGNKMCLSTLDGYLLVLCVASFDLEKLYRLADFTLRQMALLAQPKERIVFGITTRNQAVMLDLTNTDHKLIVQRSNAISLTLSRDGKLLSVTSRCGEVNVWSTCRLFNALQVQTRCLNQIKSTFKQPKPLPHCSVGGGVSQELRHLLKPERLKAMLKEYGCYPEKYRFLIWTSLLDLPCNGPQFQALIKLGAPLMVKNQAKKLKIRNDAQRRAVIKIWSCLSQWCKVLAHADFMPLLIYPFVKQLPKNSLVSFEVVATLILNHFQLWFEFHPLPPSNYLAMCDNILQHCDEELCQFYNSQDIAPKDFAWSLLSTAFSEVLEEQHWLSLWDNIVSEPPWFPVFLVVAYNVIHREIVIRLPDKRSVLMYFRDQNPVDISKLLFKARKLMAKCELALHPQRFMEHFRPIPKGVYPKFLKYPSEWIEKQEEQAVSLLKHNQEIDARIRHLELEEVQIKERLENGLKQEEHARRLREMEKLYQDTIHREEERITIQRKMLLTYQMEVRRRKSEVITKLHESEQRRKVLEMEKDIDLLMHSIERERRRHNQQMQLAEDEIRNQEMELLAQRYYSETAGAPLAQKYYDNIQKLCSQRDQLQQKLRDMTMEQLRSPATSSVQCNPQLVDIENSILEIQREFTEIITTETTARGYRSTYS
ncbi:TBC1 domain family member 31 [Drosophila eugracilis]|uniref:TBC1 domain family member 31 n=1 Tax=Drosophila eugracilis TaxID=29029 RepID=UPI0007E5F173|nr:TBC1 domain family member 31 [Drosophila eugracilis]